MSYKINNEHFANLNHLTGNRIPEPLLLSLGDNGYFSVNIAESHKCCGKAYLYDFCYLHLNDSRNKNVETLIQQGIEIVKTAGYSAVGLLHVKGNFVLDSAEKHGFKPILEFRNSRSGNELVEMILIL